VWIMSKNIARHGIWNMYVHLFEPIPEKFGYSLGGYSHREHCRAPDRKKSTEEGWEVAMKNQLVDKWYRHNRLHFVNNELWLHCRQNKGRLLPSGAIYES
jgi:hypothetical protein